MKTVPGIGDFVAERHGVPVEADYGVILAIDGNRYLFYDPFRNWEHWVPGRDLLPISRLEFTRTGYPLEDGTRVSHDVVEAVAFARQSGRFDRRERARV